MRQSEIIKYYSRKDFLDFIVDFARNREVVPRFREFFGKRPQVINYREDVLSLARQGLSSLHMSEERWRNPMMLSSDMKSGEMSDLRIGWDLILDVDTDHLVFSKAAVKLLIEALKFYEVNSFSVKFSGRSGFHLGIPFEGMPESIGGVKTSLLFPEAARIVGSYLSDFIYDILRDKLLDDIGFEKIQKATGKTDAELLDKDELFNPFSVVSIDSVAISPRHLIRAPYSFNEKTWCISTPLRLKDIDSFKLSDASPDKVTISDFFLKSSGVVDAGRLFTQAFDWKQDQDKKVRDEGEKGARSFNKSGEFTAPSKMLLSNSFPPCMNLILAGLADGRKRALFCLINFLRSSGWDFLSIENELKAWNTKNPDPLSENYIKAQLEWARKQKRILPPPNCKAEEYYTDIGVCKPDNLCSKIKNPISYALRKGKFAKDEKK